MEKIILASQSPRRKQLLEWAEINFDVVVRPTAETYPPHLAISDVPVFIARQKAIIVQPQFDPQQIILAADTIVVLNNTIIGKPEDRTHAIEILTALSGTEHQVITGVVILRGAKEISFADITSVRFHQLSPAEISFYVDKYKPYDKAGAYAIQEWIGVTGIQSVNGDFYNVMGLPVSRVIQALKTC
jgi:septum formation protein